MTDGYSLYKHFVIRCNILPDVWEFAVSSSTLDNYFALLFREWAGVRNTTAVIGGCSK